MNCRPGQMTGLFLSQITQIEMDFADGMTDREWLHGFHWWNRKWNSELDLQMGTRIEKDYTDFTEACSLLRPANAGKG